MDKTFRVVPRGVALVIGCNTFPTWNPGPGLFASLVHRQRGHRQAAPRRRSCRSRSPCRSRARCWPRPGFDPNVVTLAAEDRRRQPGRRRSRCAPRCKLIDFTGSTANGDWLEQHARQAQVYTEKAGVNPVIIDSAADFKGLVRNLAFSLSLYTGQMCTAPQNIYVPSDGIDTAEGHKSFDEVAAAIGAASTSCSATPRARSRCWAPSPNDGVLRRLEAARSLGEIAARHADDHASAIPGGDDPHAADRQADGGRRATSTNRMVRPDRVRHRHRVDTDESIACSRDAVRAHGALTMSVYSTATT